MLPWSLVLVHWSIVLSWYPFRDLSEHLLTSIAPQFPAGYELLASETTTSIVYVIVIVIVIV